MFIGFYWDIEGSWITIPQSEAPDHATRRAAAVRGWLRRRVSMELATFAAATPNVGRLEAGHFRISI